MPSDTYTCKQGFVTRAVCTEQPFVLSHGGIKRPDGTIILEFYGRVKIDTLIDIVAALNEAYKLGYEKDRWVDGQLRKANGV